MRRLLTPRQAALTLIELMVVMMILVILAGTVTLYVVNKTDQARVARTKADIKTLEGGLEMYRAAMGEYPTSEQGLDALWSPPSGADEQRWQNNGGPFSKMKNFNDPWGNPYEYYCPGTDDHDYELLCLGADGKEGGEDKYADISNWTLNEP